MSPGNDCCDSSDEVARFVTEDGNGGGADEGYARDEQPVFHQTLPLLVAEQTLHSASPFRPDFREGS